jgi:hypothetical protein
MKLTKSKLKQIIKEEMQRTMQKESTFGGSALSSMTDWRGTINKGVPTFKKFSGAKNRTAQVWMKEPSNETNAEWRYHISTEYDDDVASGTEPSFATALKKADEGLRQLGGDSSSSEYQQDMAAFNAAAEKTPSKY